LKQSAVSVIAPFANRIANKNTTEITNINNNITALTINNNAKKPEGTAESAY